MHLYTITRGNKINVDECICDLQAMYLTQTNNDKKGKKVQTYQKLGVRPIQLWEFTFPHEHLEFILSTMNYRDNDNNKSMLGANSKFAILRKILKLKNIPKLDYSTLKRQLISKEHVAFHHVGIREDLFNEHGTELL